MHAYGIRHTRHGFSGKNEFSHLCANGHDEATSACAITAAARSIITAEMRCT